MGDERQFGTPVGGDYLTMIFQQYDGVRRRRLRTGVAKGVAKPLQGLQPSTPKDGRQRLWCGAYRGEGAAEGRDVGKGGKIRWGCL